MKEHFQDYGVRRWAGDDLIELQGEPLEALQRLVEPYAPCIIQGCGINTAEKRIEPGLVALWLLDGEKKRQCVKIARFGGCPTTNLPVYLTLKCSQETRVYADGESKVVANSYTAQESILWEEVKDMYPLTITETGGTRLPENISVNFGPATEREHIESGERLPILFGKIRKWLKDLGTLAFKDEVCISDIETTLANKLNGIEANANNYTHPTTAGNKHIPAGGSSGQYLKYDSAGTAAWATPGSNTATTSAAGFMSAADKTKLEGISTGANKTIVDSTLSASSSNPVQNSVVTSSLDKKLSLSGGIMTGPIKHSISESTTDPYYISAGGGVGKNAGKYGLKLLSHDGNGQSGIGVDLTGYSYEMTIAANCSSSGTAHITFAKHTNTSTTYTRLAEIDGSGNFNAIGQIKENGTRVYSPNNKPPQATTSADGLMSAADKAKLDGIAAGAQVNPAYATAPLILDRPTNTDGYYQTGASNSSSYMNSVGSSNTVARGDHKHSLFIANATTSKPGLMSKTDKQKLDGAYIYYMARVQCSGSSATAIQVYNPSGVSALFKIEKIDGYYACKTSIGRPSGYTYAKPMILGESSGSAFITSHTGTGSFNVYIMNNSNIGQITSSTFTIVMIAHN